MKSVGYWGNLLLALAFQSPIAGFSPLPKTLKGLSAPCPGRTPLLAKGARYTSTGLRQGPSRAATNGTVVRQRQPTLLRTLIPVQRALVEIAATLRDVVSATKFVGLIEQDRRGKLPELLLVFSIRTASSFLFLIGSHGEIQVVSPWRTRGKRTDSSEAGETDGGGRPETFDRRALPAGWQCNIAASLREHDKALVTCPRFSHYFPMRLFCFPSASGSQRRP